MLGYKPGEIGDMGCFCEDNIHPEDKELFWKTFSDYVQGRTPTYEMEFRLRTKAGDFKWIYTRGRALRRDDTDRALHVVGAHADITERKNTEKSLRESEERFRQISENISEVFWLRSADNRRILYINPAYEVVWGRSCQSLYENPDSDLDNNPRQGQRADHRRQP